MVMQGWRSSSNRWAKLLAVGLISALGLVTAAAQTDDNEASPWDYIATREEVPDHSTILTDPFSSGPEVTATCVLCHTDAAQQVLGTPHWTWLKDAAASENPPGLLNAVDSFCLATASGWGSCAQCHAGYGYNGADFDFANADNVDCLVCHDTTGSYVKSETDGGYPKAGVVLLAAAQSVGIPDRRACGSCHFYPGGDGVMRGDMSSTLASPADDVDVHMGRANLLCQDCHQTEGHQITGRLSLGNEQQSGAVSCETCHGEAPHKIFRINAHCRSVACEACHIPTFAPDIPTQLEWDWSTAGLDAAPDEREWSRELGSFVTGTQVVPEYRWWNGKLSVYSASSELDPDNATPLLGPEGSIDDPTAKIWPFQLHRNHLPYDVQSKQPLVPMFFGEGGLRESWDWDSALRLGAEQAGSQYSGEFGFADTLLYFPIEHLVRPKEAALGCMECHGDKGRMPWTELGYSSDPMISGSRPHHHGS